MPPSFDRKWLLPLPALAGAIVLAPAAGAETAVGTQPHAAQHRTAAHHGANRTARPTAAATAAPATPTSAPALATRERQAQVARMVAAPMPEPSAPESVVVTGSMLQTSNNSNANPVQIITARDIQRTSATTLSDYLQRLPSMGTSGTYNTSTNGGGGIACPDIRNLGSNRVLVLVDGKRQVQNGGAGSSCVDLNTIPASMVESVEILKDGGSELYGADAVSGVINVKLKHDLTTGNVTLKGGLTQYGDNRTGMISAIKGFDFDHHRGNITIGGQYLTQGSIMQRDRAWGYNPQINNPAPGGTIVHGSGITPTATPIVGGVEMFPNGNGGFSPLTASERYNYGPQGTLYQYVQSSAVTGDAHYDVSDHLTLYANARYTHKSSQAQLSSEPLTGSVGVNDLPAAFVLPAGNPYNVWGKNVSMYKRTTEFGPRQYDSANDTWQVVAGGKGTIVDNWKYDASMTYGQTQNTMRTQGMVNYADIMQELGVSTAGRGVSYNPSVCTSQPGCTLFNPFQTWPDSAVNYAKHTEVDHATYQLRDFNLRVNNNEVVKLPYEGGGPIGLALGLEHRSEQLSYYADPEVQAGNIAGSYTSSTSGGFNATEIYGEAKIPLLHDVRFARDLTIDAQGRWSHYNTFGNAQNWKTSINWAPVRDIRFRATLGTSFRQPNVYELYGGQSVGYPAAVDPCTRPSYYGATAATVEANCARYGANLAHPSQAYANQLPTLEGGNPKLRPEIGRTYTFGTVVTPRWVPGLSASVEYWHTSLQNTIGSVGTQYIVDQCYTGSSPGYCADISPRDANGQITMVNATMQNLGTMNTDGIDFDLDYRIRLTSLDVLSVSNNFQELIAYNVRPYAGSPVLNGAGRLYYAGGGAYAGAGVAHPRVSDYATVTWTHGPYSITYMMNYIGGMKLNNGSKDLLPASATYYKVPGIFTQDITLGYRLRQWTFQAGVNNLFDKNPPFVPDGVINTDLAAYGQNVIGRYAFLQAGMDF
ncbi:TonB-dependent receptor plug domain-containing protein [Gluconacetobacter tumulicola]|nr:TonB-dependent receptor [Gluconacetobacter tumulicola]